MPQEVPAVRIRSVNEGRPKERGRFVLYWMTGFRRTRWNFALDRSVEWARRLGRPLVVLETLRGGRRWDSERLHRFVLETLGGGRGWDSTRLYRFVLEGMADNAARLERAPARYYPYVAQAEGEAAALAAALGGDACVVVTDDFPTHDIPQERAAAARSVAALVEAVDGNGLLPLAVAGRAFPTAYAFRRFLQRELPAHLDSLPRRNPLARVKLPRPPPVREEIAARWPAATGRLLRGERESLAELRLDHSVGAVETRGGARAAEAALKEFVERRLPRYAEERNEPEVEVTSGLSPYLHYGHISSHQVFAAVMDREGWSVDDLSEKATGRRSGWWGVSGPAEAFLDQLVTWRELGFNMCWEREDYERYESLPRWARETLVKHGEDLRPYVYSLEELERGGTHDALWNAAEMQLVREGRLHNYLRMLWGKKILEWSPTPEDALEAMVELNNRYALDGQDPNSYSGIFWVLGRYDRPWGPERPIFGKIRYMSSENTARKVRVKEYVRAYAP